MQILWIIDGRTSSEFIRRKSYAQELAEMGTGVIGNYGDDAHEELLRVSTCPNWTT